MATPVEPPFVKTPLPQIGTKEHDEYISAFDPDKPMPKPRSLWDRYGRLMRFNVTNDPEYPKPGSFAGTQRDYEGGWWDFLTKTRNPLRPETYRDAYLRTNPCPEEFWVQAWRWPLYKTINPKIPPPTDGKYNDYYHYVAYRNWMRRERDVLIQHNILLRESFDRCLMKEGPTNSMKNCRHIWNKYLAMTRAEELNQNLLYMAITGENVIRETPYPEDFVERKRKIYDDWLFRTRMKKPGDNF